MKYKCKINDVERIVEMDALEVSRVLNVLWNKACETADKTGGEVDSNAFGKAHLLLAAMAYEPVEKIDDNGPRLMTINVTEMAHELKAEQDPEGRIDDWTCALLERTKAGRDFETAAAEELEKITEEK